MKRRTPAELHVGGLDLCAFCWVSAFGSSYSATQMQRLVLVRLVHFLDGLAPTAPFRNHIFAIRSPIQCQKAVSAIPTALGSSIGLRQPTLQRERSQSFRLSPLSKRTGSRQRSPCVERKLKSKCSCLTPTPTASYSGLPEPRIAGNSPPWKTGVSS